ncbi:PLP-dependent aminotransferase family protein [Ensifer sp. ENS06]|uniref:aminotransferase-like domain-containing protein n=1 Tax=Ensifer sp. ENS06 TaxID=2769276 RepID=UPI00177B0DD0|nr:PLP-dependent aminotransferase family protein [Ensifer sp. ENS06]MBD9626965.1 PLP-dependent aminotransferase family protein [Ensifer sp. ENS06]
MSRVEEVVRHLSQQIQEGVYRSGQKLPSVRDGARDHGISKNSMAEAYDRLVAQGYLIARRGSGYYAAEVAYPEHSRVTPHIREAVDIVSLLREQLDQQYDVRPGDGRPPLSWMEGSEIRRHFRNSRTTTGDVEYGYGSSWGYGPLRKWLRTSLSERSIATSLDGIMLTHGVNHGLDLIIRHLLEPGDTVFVDSPGYYPLFAKLRLAKVTIVPITRRSDGPDLEEFASKLCVHRPKIFFTQSQAHNPTGGWLSPANAFGLLQQADRHGFLIVEDDVFADLIAPTLPRLAGFGQQERVLYVGSFSKTLSASLRCGYLAGSPAMIRDLVDLKMLTMVASSVYVESLVYELIMSGQYLKHLRRLRARIEEATKASVQALSELGLSAATPKVPCFYLWVPLPEGTVEQDFCRKAAESNIFVAPASVFEVERDVTRFPGMRVNVAYGASPQFVDFLHKQLRSASN